MEGASGVVIRLTSVECVPRWRIVVVEAVQLVQHRVTSSATRSVAMNSPSIIP